MVPVVFGFYSVGSAIKAGANKNGEREAEYVDLCLSEVDKSPCILLGLYG